MNSTNESHDSKIGISEYGMVFASVYLLIGIAVMLSSSALKSSLSTSFSSIVITLGGPLRPHNEKMLLKKRHSSTE